MRRTFETLSSFLSSMRSDDVRLSLMNTLRNEEPEDSFKGSPLKRLFQRPRGDRESPPKQSAL